ncbi:hypothetical protein CC79DRAFT_1352730 [Sarocladium strictum]
MDWQRLFYRQGSNVISGLTTTSTTGLPAAGTGSPLSTDVPQEDNPGGSDSNSGGSEPGRGPGSRAITFEPWEDIDDRILELISSQSRSIGWKRAKNTQIEDIFWDATISSGNGGYKEIASEAERQDPLLTYDDETDKVELDLVRFRLNRRLLDYHANNMIIRIVWRDESTGERGFTTSGVFTVVGGEEDDEQLDLFRMQFQQTSGDELTELNDGSEKELTGGTESTDPTENGLRPGVSATSTTVLSSSAISTTGPTAISSNESDSSDSGGGGGGGGLSTGAIAGIAVAGAVVFLGLIGGLVFWMLRRRRRNKDRGHYNQPTNSTTFMGGDKDIHQVTESPHSTFSNDQHVPLSSLAGAGTSRDVGGPSGHHDLHDDDGDYAPYRDDDRGAQGSAAGQRSDGAGTPHGVSRSVAHLVEDGMTEDEIRRLEEEERQLDDAIQRHGRSR